MQKPQTEVLASEDLIFYSGIHDPLSLICVNSRSLTRMAPKKSTYGRQHVVVGVHQCESKSSTKFNETHESLILQVHEMK